MALGGRWLAQPRAAAVMFYDPPRRRLGRAVQRIAAPKLFIAGADDVQFPEEALLRVELVRFVGPDAARNTARASCASGVHCGT